MEPDCAGVYSVLFVTMKAKTYPILYGHSGGRNGLGCFTVTESHLGVFELLSGRVVSRHGPAQWVVVSKVGRFVWPNREAKTYTLIQHR